MCLKDITIKTTYYKEISNITPLYKSLRFEFSSCLCNKEAICLEDGVRHIYDTLLIQFLIYFWMTLFACMCTVYRQLRKTVNFLNI
jgi:hypothetical protein